MGLTETLVLYLVVGIAVSVASYLSNVDRDGGQAFHIAAALLFWPLFLPILLAEPRRGANADSLRPATQDEMASAIEHVERELKTALSSLDGWPEAALAREKDRIGELRAALATQATRIREMDRLLSEAAPCIDSPAQSTADSSAEAFQGASSDRWKRSQLAREQNLRRLAKVRGQAHADLMATLAWIGELVSMIHLAKFTGAPTSRTEQLVAQIAAAVEGVSQASHDEGFMNDDEPQAFTSSILENAPTIAVVPSQRQQPHSIS